MRADARRNLGKIVEAAAEVMAERGVDAPMEAIAKRAGVGVGTLYRRFPDRHALVVAVGDHYIHTMADALDRASAGADAWAAIREFVTWAAEPGRAALATALAEVPQEAIAGSAEFARKRAGWVEGFDALVRRAQADGSMRADVTVEDLIHLLNVFTCHPGRLPEPVASRPVRYLHLMLDGMKAGAATPGAAPSPRDPS
ncbi:TetR family transcriptional regulator [Nonomuraea phyllanthi]|uniref:TetR family transcriptional regulator n=1 Tax=Nonomuraea phyllanthi TaxID=2219224 RepID=A0A5C4WP26_9ACTN|nr:TetR/AcrR family transcriptional regulator [Nonomuraea phyllanthi]KAB8195125.1 TetR family transcriptional regulator [Nonomuraea phyllanthi]QFY10742.1 TetR family transcriptional regulator [Nonomuraea phyllanthi]